MTLKSLAFPITTILLMWAFWLFLGLDETAYMTWVNGGPQPPGLLSRELLAFVLVFVACLVPVVAWLRGRRR